MHVLNIVTSPRKDQSVSRALVDAFLRENMKRADGIVVDMLNVWQERLPGFDAETTNAKYKGVSGPSPFKCAAGKYSPSNFRFHHSPSVFSLLWSA